MMFVGGHSKKNSNGWLKHYYKICMQNNVVPHLTVFISVKNVFNCTTSGAIDSLTSKCAVPLYHYMSIFISVD